MNLQLIPSVQHMAAMRIAQAIYYDNDIEKLIVGEFEKFLNVFQHRDACAFWKVLETKTIEKLTFLPNLLKVKVSKLMKPIHVAAFRWTSDHRRILKRNFIECYLTCKSALCWKTDGTIDRLKTAKKLAGNENFRPNERFRMACTYFLEEEILAIWYKDDEVYEMYRPPQTTSQGAVGFWVQYLSTNGWWRQSWIPKIGEYFKMTWILRSDVLPSLKWFFSHLSWDDKKSFFASLQNDFIKHCRVCEDDRFLFTRKKAANEDDLRFCLQAMDKGERWEVLSVDPVRSLLCCLMSPFQLSFIDMANQLCSLMDIDMFVTILRSIIEVRFTINYADFDYAGLLEEFWYIIPSSYKKEIKEMRKLYEQIEEVMNGDKKENTQKSLPKRLRGARTRDNIKRE